MKSYWYSRVKEDLITCDIQLSEEDIATMSKYQFKKIVDSQIREKSVVKKFKDI